MSALFTTERFLLPTDPVRSPTPIGMDAPPPNGPDDYGDTPMRGEPQDVEVYLPVVCAASLAGVPVPDRPWHVLNMIPGKTVTLLMGDGGVGKSLLAIQLAVATVAGTDWLGTSPQAGPVLYVSAEDDLDELHRRLVAVAGSYDVDVADLTDLHFVPLAGHDAVLAAPAGKAGIVAPTAIWRQLATAVEQIKPRLVILDTLADVFAGNENIRTEARQFVGLLRGLAIDDDLAVVVLAHPSLSGMASGSGTSGSTGWGNSVRSRLYLEAIKGDDGREVDPDLRVLRVKKLNYGRRGLELRLRWLNGCFIHDGGASGFDRLAAEAKSEQVFLDLLAEFARQGREVSPKLSSTYAPTVFAAHPNAAGMSKKSLAAAMERLFAAKRIAVEVSGPPSRRYSSIVFASAEGNA